MNDYLISFCVLLSLMLLYLQLAKKYNIFDVPNNRSSHNSITIRGGGIIFPISLLLAYFLFDFQYKWFVVSVIILSLVSFLDDLYSLSSIIRFIVQSLVVFLLLFELGLIRPFILLPFLMFMIVGGLNAFNFMDGINGLTALYSIVTLSTLYYINQSILFIDSGFILIPLIGVIIFSFFNVRDRAICFAGDVGSVSIAAIILFLLFKLVIHTQDYFYFLLLLVYVFDSFATILKRKFNGENIFKPHREHLYQQLVHKKEWTHLQVSLLFATVQLIINFSITLKFSDSWIIFTVFFVMIFYILGLNYIIRSEK